MNASKEIIHGILRKYSSPSSDETHCRMSALERDLVQVFEQIERQLEASEKHHEAWLFCQRIREEARPWLSRIFG